jgi:hypothetical protein
MSLFLLVLIVFESLDWFPSMWRNAGVSVIFTGIVLVFPNIIEMVVYICCLLNYSAASGATGLFLTPSSRGLWAQRFVSYSLDVCGNAIQF